MLDVGVRCTLNTLDVGTFGRSNVQTLNVALWTLDVRQLDVGPWKLDGGRSYVVRWILSGARSTRWTLDSGRSTKDVGRKTFDSARCTLHVVRSHVGRCRLDVRHWLFGC